MDNGTCRSVWSLVGWSCGWKAGLADLITVAAGSLALIAFVVAAAFYLRAMIRSCYLIRHCCFADESFLFGYLDALIRLLGLIRRSPLLAPGMNVTRLMVEIEMLDPLESRPMRYGSEDFETYRQLRREWRHTRRDWRRRRSEKISDMISSYDRKYSDAPEVIEVDTVANLIDAEDQIKRYFAVLRRLGHLDTSFVSNVVIKDGFLAPLFLIAGLQARFKEDWRPLMRRYSPEVIRDAEKFRRFLPNGDPIELAELRLFQFNCWLMWGPSIPACRCTRWSGPATFQLGYGDENNSIGLLHPPHKVSKLRDLLRPGAGVCARRARVVGEIRWGGRLSEDGICRCQRAILGGIGPDRTPENARVVVELVAVSPSTETNDAQFHSAYIWLMLHLSHGDERSEFFPAGRHSHGAWRNLLPVFEHGNIADASTFKMLKRTLVQKTVLLVASLLEANPELVVSLACAFDDSRCPEGVQFPAPTGEAIADILGQSIGDKHLRTGEPVTRRFDLHSNAAVPLHQYRSCRLPEIVEQYYRELATA